MGIAAGYSLTTGNINIDIGSSGIAGEANTIRLGTTGIQTAAYIAGITGVTVTGNPVVIDESGHLGTADIRLWPWGLLARKDHKVTQAQLVHKVQQVQPAPLAQQAHKVQQVKLVPLAQWAHKAQQVQLAPWARLVRKAPLVQLVHQERQVHKARQELG